VSDAVPEMLAAVAAYYTSKLAEHGASARGVDWNGAQSHECRHRQFLRLLEGSPEASIIDLGCGFGDFLRFVRREGYRGHFAGYDIAAAMIEKARALHGETELQQWGIGAEPRQPADFAIASGIFNVKGEVAEEIWACHVLRTIDVLARSSRRGFAFNVLSLSSDVERRRGDLYYADPAAMFTHCLSHYGRSVALLQDYGLYEFTLIVRHAPAA
jgi:SAM-dependent methyltransferase